VEVERLEEYRSDGPVSSEFKSVRGFRATDLPPPFLFKLVCTIPFSQLQGLCSGTSLLFFSYFLFPLLIREDSIKSFLPPAFSSATNVLHYPEKFDRLSVIHHCLLIETNAVLFMVSAADPVPPCSKPDPCHPLSIGSPSPFPPSR